MLKYFIILTSLLFTSSIQVVFATQNFSSIKTQATLANATYLDVDELKAAMQAENIKLVRHTTLPESQVSYFLTQYKGVQTIAIRGTANLQNAMVDIDLALQADASLGIILHQGFASAARAVYLDVKPYLADDIPIQTTGHSLGGAVAVILSMYLTQNDYNLSQIITFGQPKVTNVAGAEKFSYLPLTRIVTAKDIVPLVPPLSPMQIKELDIYWHMGEEVILLDNSEYSQTNGIKSMLRATKFTSSVPNEENLSAHQMSNYVRLVDELINDSVEIPYKTEISFWGISIN